MGGLQVIFTGDFLQLPPVARGQSGPLPTYFTQESSGSSYDHRLPGRSQPNPSCSDRRPASSSTHSQLCDRGKNGIPPDYKGANERERDTSASCILPPEINSARVLKARFCFQSSVWEKTIGTNTFVLTNIFRQSDAVFASLLNSVRCGELTGSKCLNTCVVVLYFSWKRDPRIKLFGMMFKLTSNKIPFCV